MGLWYFAVFFSGSKCYLWILVKVIISVTRQGVDCPGKEVTVFVSETVRIDNKELHSTEPRVEPFRVYIDG